MKDIIKKIQRFLPKFIRVFLYQCYEKYNVFLILKKIKKEEIKLIVNKKASGTGSGQKKKILFYHKNGLSFGGTEKFLQIIAKHLPKDRFDVYFMASWDDPSDYNRKKYLDGSGIKFINFSFSSVDDSFPYFINNQNPDIFSVIKDNDIDIVVSAGAGYADYPLNLVKNIPIILIGVFGYATTQKNIVLQVYISDEVGRMVEKITYGRTCLMPILSEDPGNRYAAAGLALRNSLGIPDNHTVYGRIGRGDDNIFDPIGIRAFQELLKERRDISYIIMSPPPILEKIVEDKKIENVYFLPPSYKEDDIWAFHNAIDVLAHFRKDGESQGLNIVESMLCAKPVITHCSRIWNAHLEYLDDSFSRVADLDSINDYYVFMKEMADRKKNGTLADMGNKARKKAERIFLIENRLPEIIDWFDI